MKTASNFDSLSAGAALVLTTADTRQKAELAGLVANRWRTPPKLPLGDVMPPERPARPVKPPLLPPRDMPKRRMGGKAGRVALLHAIAHIELNAIDLAFDLIGRFLPRLADTDQEDFASDWIRVGSEEAKHFLMLERCLEKYEASYGDLPAHDGLWEAAQATQSDLLGRLAVVPMVLEARGLDVTPKMIGQFEKAGDEEAAAALQTIYQDEIGHVEIGTKWFRRLCKEGNKEPVTTFKSLVSQYFKGSLKPPFNDTARSQAGLLPQFYQNSID